MDLIIRLLIVGGIITLSGYLIMNNTKVLRVIDKSKKASNSAFYIIIGKYLEKMNIKLQRTASVNKKSILYKVNKRTLTILENLDMTRDDVTPVGFLVFVSSLSLSLSIFYVGVTGAIYLIVPAFGAVFYLVLVVFKLLSLIRCEAREAEIMDAMDLIVSDIKGGVYNAIVRYRDAFHPNIRPCFLEFIDDITEKGYSFKDAIANLNYKLGNTFTDFAQKAVLYEEKADDSMDDIFSSIIETNRYRRTLRDINNREFNKLRTELVVSLILIVGYGLFAMTTDPFVAKFFTKALVGKLMIIADIIAVAWVLGFIAALKAKSL